MADRTVLVGGTFIRAATVAAISLVAASCSFVTSSQSPSEAQAPAVDRLTETERAIHLLDRATYGARPGDVEEVLRVGRNAWLGQQLHPETIAEDERVEAVRYHAGQTALTNLTQLALNKLTRTTYARRQLEEVMTDFWFNHFNVSYNKQGVSALISHYETTAIREHVFGRFEDLLAATAQHPAMIIYLDNFLSSAPTTDSARAVSGLNENYARELLELHTLGVEGGYTQSDVIEVARAFTGWTVPTRQRRESLTGPITLVPASFRAEPAMTFEPTWHDRDPKAVLGHTLAGERGMEDGIETLAILARHPSTARFIATKLVQYFVADDPPERLVNELARIFTATDGDLREVTRALFTSEEFYDPAHYRTKAKRPFELIASALRVTGADLKSASMLFAQLRTFRHVPYAYDEPTGYPVTAADWINAGAILARANFALSFADPGFADAHIEPFKTLGLSEEAAIKLLQPSNDPSKPDSAQLRKWVDLLLERTLYGVPAPELANAIVDGLTKQYEAERRWSFSRAIGLVLGSAEFQKY